MPDGQLTQMEGDWIQLYLIPRTKEKMCIRDSLRGNRLMLRGIGMTEKELEILGIFHAGE